MIEIWNDIAGYEAYYQVSNLGRIKRLGSHIKCKNGSLKFWKERILSEKKYNYKQVELSVNGVKSLLLVHRLVAAAFLIKPDGKDWVNHIDGDPSNNTFDNLEWCTPSENELHKIHTLNIKPTVSNFKKIIQTENITRYNGKNIFGKDLQALLLRFQSGEIISLRNLSRLEKRKFYGQVNELRYRFGVNILTRSTVTIYKDYFLSESAIINMENKASKGACKIWAA